MPRTYSPRRSHSEETKKKISESVKAHHAALRGDDADEPKVSKATAASRKARKAEELHLAYLKLAAELLARKEQK